MIAILTWDDCVDWNFERKSIASIGPPAASHKFSSAESCSGSSTSDPFEILLRPALEALEADLVGAVPVRKTLCKGIAEEDIKGIRLSTMMTLSPYHSMSSTASEHGTQSEDTVWVLYQTEHI